ncbi:MAG: hypothetical protein V1743_00915 [Nanoarchaeota archaeon]
MDFDTLFLSGGKERTTKGLIIRCLAAHQEISIVQLHTMLRAEFQRNVSYQAIRQAITELFDKGVVLRNEKSFSLNSAWVLDLKDMVDILERSTRKQQVQVLDRQTTQVSLKNLYELGHFILFGLDHKYFDMSQKGELFLQLNHLWIPFSDQYRRDCLIKIFKENMTKVIVKGNTAADKMLKLWYKKYGEVKLGVKFSSPAEYIVHGDSVVQIFMDEQLQKKMDEVYCLKGIVKGDLFSQVSDMTYTDYGIQLIITRNAKVADRVKKEILAHFK